MLVESIEREKPSFHPNSPFLSRNKNYSSIVSMLRTLLKPPSSPVEEPVISKRSLLSTGTVGSGGSSSSLLPMELSSVNPRQLLDRMKGKKMEEITSSQLTSPSLQKDELSSKNYPIILIPFSSKASINMFNVKEFLENHRYISPDEARTMMNGKKPSIITINRKKSSNETLSYFVTDSASKLRPQDWKRVIAVFAQGVAWQFKDWPEPFNTPAQLFSTVQGFHIKPDEEELDPKVKGWNVVVLNVHKTHPHLDLESVVALWRTLDSWINARGYIHSATGGIGFPA